MTLTDSMQKCFIVLSLGALASCATTHTMTGSPATPGSQGTLKATGADNGNARLEVRVKHLPPPGTVVSGTTTYVVWVQPQNMPPQNVGALNVNGDYEGALDTLTPHSQFRLFITPELTGVVGQPGHDPVFTQQVDSVR